MLFKHSLNTRDREDRVVRVIGGNSSSWSSWNPFAVVDALLTKIEDGAETHWKAVAEARAQEITNLQAEKKEHQSQILAMKEELEDVEAERDQFKRQVGVLQDLSAGQVELLNKRVAENWELEAKLERIRSAW